MTVESVLHRFSSYKKSGKWYITHCPCHKDERQSLGLTTCYYKNGKTGIAVKCFAGCSAKSIKAWLKTNEVCEPQEHYTKTKKKFQKREIIATYPYCTFENKLAYEVVRFEPKEFSQRRKDKDGKYVWGLTEGYYYNSYGNWFKCKDAIENYEKVKYFPEVQTLLYNLNTVTQGLSKNENARVFIVGGEKDVETLKRHRFLAVTNSGGEGDGKWKPEFSDALTNVNIVFIPDNDITGYEHLYRVAESVIPVCKSFKVVELPNLKKEHEDITDWYQKYQGSADYLKKLVDNAEDYKYKLESIKKDFVFKLPSINIKPTQSDFITALQEEAKEISNFKDLSLVGLCIDCRGTGYVVAKVDDSYTTFFAEKSENFIRPVACACSMPEITEELEF